MSKWFVMSRGLWSAGIPLVVAVLVTMGLDTTDLANQLEEVGTALALAVSSALGLYSRFVPDYATLTVVPEIKK